MITDRERAVQLVRCLDEAFTRQAGVLAERDDLVESQVPPGATPGSLEQALFLFYVVPSDRGTKSSRLYTRAKELYAERPLLFDPTDVVQRFSGIADPHLVEATGRALGSRYPAETARAWYTNSVTLIARHSGDPRRLLSCSSDARALLKEIQSFRGFGPKTGGMFLRAAIGLGYAVCSNLEDVLVPVDVHDCRISWQTGVIRSRTVTCFEELDYHRHVALVQKILRDTCRDLRVSWLNVDRALWLIGSRCCVAGRCTECPLAAMCCVSEQGPRERAKREPLQATLWATESSPTP